MGFIAFCMYNSYISNYVPVMHTQYSSIQLDIGFI